MDAIDKQLWIELATSCRYSYKNLGDKLGISANAVKQRVDKLLETGFIQKWHLKFSLAMIDAQFAFIEVKTDGSQEEEKMIKTLGNHPMIFVVLPLTTGDFILHAEYIGPESLLEIASFIRSVDSVSDVKVHPTIANLGDKMVLNPLHLRVLRFLVDDPRASVTDLARLTGLNARRVRKLVDELVESNAFDFSFVWNPNAGNSLAFISRIVYDPKVTLPNPLERGIRNKYPIEYFYSHVSAIEPIMFCVFMVDHVFEIQAISREIRKLQGIKSLSTMIYYSAIVLEPPSRKRLVEIISQNQ